MSAVLLQVKNLKKEFGKKDGKTKALDGIEFQLLQGEFVGIMGSSGSGKTTLLHCIATTLKPTSGEIFVENKNITSFREKEIAKYRGKQIGYLFQNFELIDNLTVKENIMLPLMIQGKTEIEKGKKSSFFQFKTRKEDQQNQKENELRVIQICRDLGIEDILEKFPNELSGGQKQRVAAARAFILEPGLILMDEPTGALDSKNAKVLLEKICAIHQKKHASILIVTHDANVACYCSRILFIQDGKIFHELRRKGETESKQAFYERILLVMAQIGGGSANVL